MGMVFSVVAFASLTGSPIAGALIDRDGGRYLGAQVWAGTSMMLGAVALTVARVARTGWKLREKTWRCLWIAGACFNGDERQFRCIERLKETLGGILSFRSP